jgi:hypothetical protein
MRTKISFGTRLMIAFIVIAGWFSVSPSRMAAQIPAGQKAVFGPNGVTPSTVWVDASAWWSKNTTQPDLCAYIQDNILTSAYGTSGHYPNGTVIDARGLAYGIFHQMQQIGCSVDPFGALQGPPPSTTILLPSGNIQATTTWHIPNNTRIVGDEQQTEIIAESGFNGSYIIEMGGPNALGYDLCPANSYCTSVAIEHLILGGNGSLVTVGGIDNQHSQGGSYVNDVVFNSFVMTGLLIGAGGANSGPYSNIVYYAFTCTQNSCPTPSCIDLEAQTQGVHGVSCLGNNGTDVKNKGAGIIVNASNNSIEDVHVESYWDGIQVGPTANVANVVISNVAGWTTGGTTGGSTTNTVHICGPNSWNSSSFGNCGGSNGTKDITILHAMIAADFPPQTTVVDDVSQNAIVGCNSRGPGCATPLSTAIYVLGEQDPSTTNLAYSKLASTPATMNGNYQNNPITSYIPTWGVNSIPPPNNYCSPIGAIYSNNNAAHSGSSVYVCNASGQWASIP